MARSGGEDGRPERLGVWLVGVRGGVATTVIAGARLVARGLAGATGLVTETQGFRGLPLVPLDRIIFGGHDIRPSGTYESARQIAAETRSLDPEALRHVKEDLDAVDAEVRPGTAHNSGPAIRRLAQGALPRDRTPAAAVERLAGDLQAFRTRHHLERVVVVHVASTEPPLEVREDHEDPERLRALLQAGRSRQVRASMLYSLAAIEAGCAVLNFTPNTAALLPGAVRLAERVRLPVMGNDGKTGETLVKSALAPLFLARNLQVLAWQGYNILGDRDGLVLGDPVHKPAKLRSKDRVVSGILGYPLHTHVGIDYVPSLGDQKTAWDFIHFAGFLGVKMSLQFIWQGCDAILAAPLVLDLVRLMDLAWRRGERGLRPELAAFFKSPIGGAEHGLVRQMDALQAWVARMQAGTRPGTRKATRTVRRRPGRRTET
jgi:myo-inositol-1-phosphate synthase